MTRRLFVLAILATLFGGAPGAAAGERTVTLRVPMFCASCPYIVRRALEEVAGVLTVEASYPDQIAVVTFDDEKVEIAALTAATAEIGFPSEPVETE